MEQKANKSADKNTDDAIQARKLSACPNNLKVNGESGDAMEDTLQATADLKSTHKSRGEDGGSESSKEDSISYDSQDEIEVENAIKVKTCLAQTAAAEGQKLYKLRVPKDMVQNLAALGNGLEKLHGNEGKSKSEECAEETSAKPSETPGSPKVIPGIARLTWTDYRPFPRFQEEPEVVFLRKLKEVLSPFTIASNNYVTPAARNGQLHHVLEVLVEGPEIWLRRQGPRGPKSDDTSDATIQTSKPTPQCPERVRICSKPLLAILRQMVLPDSTTSWDVPHLVFLRPFKIFILWDIEIRGALKCLEKKWRSMDETFPSEKASVREIEGQMDKANKFDGEEIETPTTDPAANKVVQTETFEALEHLRLLGEFLDNDLQSTFDLRKKIKAKELCSIAFADLWHLYEHGQEVRTPDHKLQVFRVVGFSGGRDVLSGPSTDSKPPFASHIEREESNGAFFVECYRLDFDGLRYGPVATVFEIRRYEGLKDVTSLQVYPMRFGHDYLTQKTQLLRRGEKFIKLARVKKFAHKTYCGLSLDEHAEEIESPIIVDFELAYDRAGLGNHTVGFQRSTLDYDPRETWEADICRFEGCRQHDDTHQDLEIDFRVSEKFMAECKPHMVPVKDPNELAEDELILLPYSVYGFVLRSRKWRKFNIDDVEDVKYSSGFDDLVLPPGHKDTVEALVNRHSGGTNVDQNRTAAETSMDLVTGKGKGLIILLHGAPGVGKTSTAECVANKTERPLFPITCGDLGESAIEVEESLERNFFLAHKWGCVLLLDEADVFLTLRNQTDLRRNAVVSVFLRTLEYYDGILFLNTNRVGVLDPAFKSRIHISLYYPKLSRKASSEIWRNHIRKAKDYFEKRGWNKSIRKSEIMEFSKQHFKDLRSEQSEPWNGRQIRNAFQTAIALAEYEAYLKGGRPELAERHFAKVAKASSDFDKYLRMTHGRSESQLAEATKIRTDDPEKAAKKMAELAQRQRLRGQPKSEDESSDSDSLENDSSDADDASSSDEAPPPKASKRTKKQQKVDTGEETSVAKKSKKEKARPQSTSGDEAPARRKTKKGKAKQESTSEEEPLPTKKAKKEKANQESASEEEEAPTKKTKKEKESRKKSKELSSDEKQDSSEEGKEEKKQATETKGKEKDKGKSKTTSKSFN